MRMLPKPFDRSNMETYTYNDRQVSALMIYSLLTGAAIGVTVTLFALFTR